MFSDVNLLQSSSAIKSYVLFFFLSIINQSNFSQIFTLNDRLGRGVNIGNALEAPNEGEWGVTIQERYFKLIADKGFNSVRIPINWSTAAHAGLGFPYTVSEQLFSRVDWVIQNSLKNKLSVVICMHHYDELYTYPEQHKQRFLAIWDQISNRYKNYTDSVYFEPLNEPEVNINSAMWNDMFSEVLTVVRKTNPTRAIIVGPTNYNDINKLDSLILPKDNNLILTVHYYSPAEFVDQGAHWMPGYDEYLGTAWDNTESQRKQIFDAFLSVKNYADSCKLPVYVGEYGTLQTGDRYSRHLWTNYVARSMDSLNFKWAYFDFCYLFGLYNDTTKTWRNFLVDALLKDSMYQATQPVIVATTYSKDFNMGISPWTLYVTSPASASASVLGGTCHVSIPNAGSSIYDVKLVCPNLNFVVGKSYMVSFDIYGSGQGNIICIASKASAPWTPYSMQENLVYSATKQHIAFNLTMLKPSDTNAMIVLSFGNGASGVYISNFKIQEISFKVAEVVIEGRDSISSIIGNNGSLLLNAKVYPIHAANKAITWSVENLSGKAVISNSGLLQAMGKDDSNGLVKVIAASNEDPTIKGTLLVTISGQHVGVAQKQTDLDNVFPNPVSGEFLYVTHATKISNELFTLSLSDLTGKQIFRDVFRSDLVTIQTGNLLNGIYLLTVNSISHKAVYKVVVAR